MVLMLAGEFIQNKFLGQTAGDMETHVNPKVFEYMPGGATRTGVVSGGNGISNQTAAPLRIIRLRCSIVSLTDKWSQHGVASPRPLCAGALVEIARILMQKRWQNRVADQASGRGVGEACPQPLAISFRTLPPFVRVVTGLLDASPSSHADEKNWIGQVFVS